VQTGKFDPTIKLLLEIYYCAALTTLTPGAIIPTKGGDGFTRSLTPTKTYIPRPSLDTKLSNLLFSASLAASFAVCFKSGTSETEQTHKTCICCVSIVCCAVTCTTYDFMMDCAVHSSCTLDVPSPHCTMHIYLSIYICIHHTSENAK